MKAINAGDVACSDKNGKTFQVKTKADLDRVHVVVITSRHQKIARMGNKYIFWSTRPFQKHVLHTA